MPQEAARKNLGFLLMALGAIFYFYSATVSNSMISAVSFAVFIIGFFLIVR